MVVVSEGFKTGSNKSKSEGFFYFFFISRKGEDHTTVKGTLNFYPNTKF